MVHGFTAFAAPRSSMSQEPENNPGERGGFALINHLYASEHSRIDTWESLVFMAVARIGERTRGAVQAGSAG